MTGKQAGLGMNCYVAGNDLSGDIGSIRLIGGGNKPLDLTDITQSAHERGGGVRDGQIGFTAYFNPTRAHPILAALPTADQVVTATTGTSLGDPAASVVSKLVGYNGKRAHDGGFLLDTDAVANGFGLEWGRLLTAGKRTDGAATNGTGFDFVAVSTAFGLQAYLQVFAFAGTDATVKIQDATTLGGAYTDITGAAFTQITGGAPLTQRIATGATQVVRQFLRVVTVTTGGFTNLVFAVAAVRNDSATVF